MVFRESCYCVTFPLRLLFFNKKYATLILIIETGDSVDSLTENSYLCSDIVIIYYK